MKKVLVFGLILALALSLVGVGVAESAAYKDTMRVGVNSDQTTLDPQNNRSNNIVLSQIYNGLAKRDMDNQLVPDLAESWEVSEDELTWTFHLKKGVKFHNGVEFTARDVKATIERTIDPVNTVNTTTAMNFIKSVNIVDDYTVQLMTEKPVGPFMQTLAGNLGARIMCAEVIEQYGASDEFGFTPETVVGTGPYKLKSWSREEEIVLEGFDDYFGEKAKTRNVVFQIITDATARGVAVETGEIDICFRLSPSDAGRLKDAEGLEVLILPGHGLHAMMFNLSKPMIQDAKVRQAVLLATDVPAMVEALLADLGETPCVAPCSPLYFGFFDMGTHPYDAERSKALLAEAGYPDGIDLSMMVSPTYNKAVEMAEILAAQMAEANIRVSIEVLESAAFSAAMASKNPADKPWDMWLTGMGNLVLDFTELRNAFRSTAEGTTEPNGSFYSNPEIDELLDAAAYTTNDEARLAAYKRATEILWNEDPGALWLNYRKNVFAIRDTVENFRCNAGSESNLYEVLVRAQ